MRALILALLLFTGMVDAQIVNIPDPNFKAALISLGVDTNVDGEIQLTEAQNTVTIYLNNETSVTSVVGISSFTNMTSFMIVNSPLLTTVDVSGLTNLSGITLDRLTSLTSLNVSGCSGLTSFSLDYTHNISSLNFSGLANLEIVTINGTAYIGPETQLTSLNLTGCTGLKHLSVSVTTLSVLDVSPCVALEVFEYSDNYVPNLDLSGLIHLQRIYASSNTQSNTLLSINANGCTALTTFFGGYNNQLKSVYLKNGSNETVALYQCDNLEFVCLDESQLATVQTHVSTFASSSAVCSSYCTFTPGGNYNTITGTLTFDANGNGCDSSDPVKPNVKVDLGIPNVAGSTFTNASGNYTFYTNTGNFQWTPTLENPAWFTISPTQGNTSFANSNNTTVTQNFCISPNGSHPDLEIVIEPIESASPGELANYKIVYKNKGNQSLSGNIALTFDDSRLDFLSAFPSVTTLAANNLSWSYTNLLPFENRAIVVVFDVNSPSDTPAVNIGDVLNFTASITPLAGDEIPSDNSFALRQTVVASADSNGITCLEGTTVPTTEVGRYLHYVVNFENTGTSPAENVVIKIIIDTNKFDINSLQLMHASNPCYTRITGNILEFIFENINLSAATGNPRVGGHGDVLFKIKSKDTLVNGDQVSQTGKVYFDYNAPVNTNISQTTYQILSNGVHHLDDSIIIYPNPTDSVININCSSIIKTIEMYDIQGRLLETDLNDTNNKVLDISSKQNGIYFLKITSDKGSKIEKIVKK